MVTVSHLIEKEIETKPFLQEALSRGIVNHAALADELLPIVEKQLKKKVTFSAVNMAIRRLSEKINNTFITKTMFNNESDISIKSNLIEITLFKSRNAQNIIQKIYGLVDYRKGDFLTITQGINELMIITNERLEKKISALLPPSIIKKKIKKLSSLTVSIPEESINTIGLFYVITRALNWENISIVDIVSTLTEMTFIVYEKDTSRAFDKLQELLRTNVKK